MEAMTITEVSKTFSVSTRMIRYYEKIGLIESGRIENYAYRTYDQTAVCRLQMILVLRKLRIPLKQIEVILNDSDQIRILQTLQENVQGIEDELEALDLIRTMLHRLIDQLEECMGKNISFDLLKDQNLIAIANTFIFPKTNLKEEYSMGELVEASKVIDKKMEVRIVYLPPATIAASHYIGKNPEDIAGRQLEEFIKEVDLLKLKPGFRVYGFNSPSPQEGQTEYGYEFWTTIPEDLNVSAPMIKKEFAGGLYAAHCIKMGDFQEWGEFFELMKQHPEYEIDWREPEGMGGCLEEHLNANSVYQGVEKSFTQLDLLIPIKKKCLE